MKRYFVLLLSLIFSLFFVNMQLLSADCEDMIKEADKIKVFKMTRIPKYEEIEGEGTENDFLIGVRIEGLNERIYAKVSNDYDDKIVTLNQDNLKDGVAEVSSPYIYKSVKMTVSFYSSDESCNVTDALKVINIDTDIFNEFYYYKVCNENPDLEVCAPTYDNSKYNEDTFKEMVDELIEERDKTILDKTLDFFKEYYLFILIPILLISVIFIVRIVLLKRGMKNE